MYIEEKIIERRLKRITPLYCRCNNIKDVLEIYRKNTNEYLQKSKVEIYCLNSVLEKSYLWYRAEWDFDSLYEFIVSGREIEEIENFDSQKGFFINVEKLEEIRENAEEIENRLLEPTEENTPVEDETKNINEYMDKVGETETIIDDDDDEISEWHMLVKSFESEKIVLLGKIVEKDNAYDFLLQLSKKQQKLPEIVIEEINEKALDIVGDTIIEMENSGLHIYEDYQEELKKYL